MTRKNGDMTTTPPRPRPTARLIVLDDEDRVLLFQFEDPNVYDPNDPRGAALSPIFWATPGGGVEPGETYEAAALRELGEETGLNALELTVYRDHRWWTLAELRATDELIYPEELAEIVSRGIANAHFAPRRGDRDHA